MRKLVMLAAMLAMMLVVSAPAMAAGGVESDLPAAEGEAPVAVPEQGGEGIGPAGAAALSQNDSDVNDAIIAAALANQGNGNQNSLGIPYGSYQASINAPVFPGQLPFTGGPSPAAIGASALLTGGGLLALGGTMIARRKSNEMA